MQIDSTPIDVMVALDDGLPARGHLTIAVDIARPPAAAGHSPNDQAALKVLYLVIRTPRSNRANVTGTTTGWKKALLAMGSARLRDCTGV